MRILFVSRDNGGAKMSVPTAQLALERGHEIGLVVEGLAADRFQDAGFLNAGSKVKLLFKGPENMVEIPFTLDCGRVLRKFVPNVVVATRSIPESLESRFGIEANEVKIPFVLMEDYWAGHRTCRAKPDLAVTLDEYGEKLVKETHPNTQTAIAGNPTVIKQNHDDIPVEVRARVEELRHQFDRVFLFVGGNPEETTAELQLLLECLKITQNWCLIMRPHPTIAKQEKEPGVMWSDFWSGMLTEFGERIVSVECKVGDHLAMLCDATISGFSLMLNTAAYARKATISLRTEIGDRILLNDIGLTEVPIVALGCARQVNEPCDLDTFGLIRSSDEASLAKLKPFNPAIALEAIERLVRK